MWSDATTSECASCDEGFTFVELLVAFSLLLVTLIAVAGLSLSSSFMAGTAHQKTAMVNASAGYLERVRQQPYAEVGTPGGDPDGTLIASVTPSNPYTITITPRVTWGRPEDPTNRGFKTVTLEVSSTNAQGGALMSYSTAAVFADVGVASGGGGAPSVDTTPAVSISIPPDGSVVFGNVVSVTASATANSTARSLVWIQMFDGLESWGSVAVSGTSAQHTYTWDTTAAREGRHSLTPRVTDNAPKTVDGAPVVVTVDNVAPGVPTGTSALFPDGSSTRLSWTGATDGTDTDGGTPVPASHYSVTVYRQPASTASASDYKLWTKVSGLTDMSVAAAPSAGAPLVLSSLTDFSRFAFTISSSSPDRGASPGLESLPVTAVGATKQTAAGTWRITYNSSNKKYSQYVTFNVPTGPTFPWTGTAVTRLYRMNTSSQAITSGTLILTNSSVYPAWKTTAAPDNLTGAANAQPTPYWYGATTTLTPQGFGSASIVVESCVLGPPAVMNTVATQQLVIARW